MNDMKATTYNTQAELAKWKAKFKKALKEYEWLPEDDEYRTQGIQSTCALYHKILSDIEANV